MIEYLDSCFDNLLCAIDLTLLLGVVLFGTAYVLTEIAVMRIERRYRKQMRKIVEGD